MPTYRAPDGARFYFEIAPKPGSIRADLIPISDEDAAAAEASAPAAVPDVISMRQARLALLGAGLLTDIDAIIASLPSPMKEAAQIEWEFASEVARNSPLIATLAPSIGLDAGAIDALFVAAIAL